MSNVAVPFVSLTEKVLFEKLPETKTSSVASLGTVIFTDSTSSTVIFATSTVIL